MGCDSELLSMQTSGLACSVPIAHPGSSHTALTHARPTAPDLQVSAAQAGGRAVSFVHPHGTLGPPLSAASEVCLLPVLSLSITLLLPSPCLIITSHSNGNCFLPRPAAAQFRGVGGGEGVCACVGCQLPAPADSNLLLPRQIPLTMAGLCV